MSDKFTLGKNEKLKSRKQIEKLFAEGRSFVANPFKIYYEVTEIDNGKRLIPMAIGINVQFGVGVSSKNFKRAVDRNRIKRLTREAWRLQNNELKEKVKALGKRLHVFFIYTGKELPDFITIKVRVAAALKKLLGKVDENVSANS